MERPLVALAENVGNEFLRRPVVVGEEVVFVPVGVGRVDVGHHLHVGAGEIPGEFRAPRADAELVLGQVAQLEPGFERQAERTEAVLRVDAVAVEFAGTAAGEHDVRAEHDAQAVGIIVVGAVEHDQAARLFVGAAAALE